MAPHPDLVRVQAFRMNIMLKLLESITFMRFGRLEQAHRDLAAAAVRPAALITGKEEDQA